MDFNHKLIKLTIHRGANYSRSRCALKYESYFCNFALIEGMQQLSVDRKKDNIIVCFPYYVQWHLLS